tara:strand:- start:290 stop:1096 length:807 start_codon:yes stop_codon:yes gene_type:complete
MIEDPYKLNKLINRLSYFDKFHLSFLKKIILRRILDQHNSLDLSASIEGIDFKSKKINKSVLIIGNANSTKNKSTLINNFDGDIIRFNRFKTENCDVGEKTTHWAISRGFATNKEVYGNELEKTLKINMHKHKNIKVFVATYPVMPDFNHEIIDSIDLKESFNIFKEMCQHYIKLNGFLFPYESSFFNSHHAFKPSTGMLVILNSILLYENVHIVNFDSFRSDHYWKESNRSDKVKYHANNSVIGNHQPILESSILITLEKIKLISRL